MAVKPGCVLDLLEAYGSSGKLRIELKALHYENPQIAEQRKMVKNQAVEMMNLIGGSLMMRDLKVKNPRIALLLIIWWTPPMTGLRAEIGRTQKPS